MNLAVSIVLRSLVTHGHAPVPIYGATGRPIGHARFDEKAGTHILEIPYEDWEGGVGEQVMRYGISPTAPWLPLVRVALVDARDDKKEEVGAPAAVGTEQDLAPAPATHFDDINAGFLRTVRDGHLARLEEEKIEEVDGKSFKVKRELVPSVRQEGNNTIPEGTTLIPVNAFVSIAETRTPIEKPAEGKAESTFVEDTKKAIGGVEGELAPQGIAAHAPPQRTPEGQRADTLAPFAPSDASGRPIADPADPAATTGTSEVKTGEPVPDAVDPAKSLEVPLQPGERMANPDDVRVKLTSEVQRVEETPVGTQGDAPKPTTAASAESDDAPADAHADLSGLKFRQLRKIAKVEGVADFEALNKSEELIAAIQLNREGKTNTATDGQ